MDIDDVLLEFWGNQLVFLGDGLIAIASQIEFNNNQEQDNEVKKELELIAGNFEIIGIHITLLGDALSLIAAQKILENLQNPSEKELKLAELAALGTLFAVIEDLIDIKIIESAL